MRLDQAIQTAIAYEIRIRDIYRDAAQRSGDPIGQRVYRNLAEDEQRHIDYLESRLDQWRGSGKITLKDLDTAIPSLKSLQQAAADIATRLTGETRTDEKQALSKALKAEIETSRFYQEMVDTLTDEGQKMFARFLEIEKGHIDAVQAELDFLSKTGYWLDFKEFDME